MANFSEKYGYSPNMEAIESALALISANLDNIVFP